MNFRKRDELALLSAAAAILLAAVVLCVPPAPAHAAQKLPAPAWPKVLRSGAHALKLSWEPVEGARSYAVYRYDGDRARYVKVKATRKTRWRDTGLQSDVTYRYKVAACAEPGGKRPGKRSYKVAARAYTKGAAKVNPSRPEPARLSYTAALAMDSVPHQLMGDVRVRPSRYGKRVGAKGCRAFSRDVRFRSSDPQTVRLTRVASGYPQSYWRVRAQRTGACRVWAVAANGVRSRPVEVTVVDATRPARFTDPGFYDPEVVRWLNDEADTMSRAIKRCMKTGFHTNTWLDDRGVLTCNANRYLDGSDSTLAALKSDRSLLVDVQELLAHDVRGFRVESVFVSPYIVVRFRSDVIEGRNYWIEYTPNTRGSSSDYNRVAPYWHNIYADPIE